MNKSFLTLYLLGLALLSVVACSTSGIGPDGVTAGGASVGYTDPAPVQTSSNPPTLNPNAYTVATSPTALGSSTNSGTPSCNVSSYDICVKNVSADSCTSDGGVVIASCPAGYLGSCKSSKGYLVYYYAGADSSSCSN